MPGIPSEDACFFGGTPRNYALTFFRGNTPKLCAYNITVCPHRMVADSATLSETEKRQYFIVLTLIYLMIISLD